MKSAHLAFIATISFIAVLITPSIIYAQENEASPSANIQDEEKSGIEIEPAVIDVDITESEPEKDISFSITNHNDYPITLELTPINFQQKDLTGITQFLGETSETFDYSLASYIHIPFEELQIEPGEKRDVEITIRNRQDLSPGGHYAGIIARQVVDNVPEELTAVRPAVSTLLFLRKTGGERFNLSIQDVNWPESTFEMTYPKKITITFQNEGNVHLTPYGRVEIRDMFNRLISKGIINSASSYVFPSSRRRLEIDMKQLRQPLPVSFNKFTINGQDSLKKTTYLYQETYIYYDPIPAIVLIITSIGFMTFVARNKKKLWRRK